MIECVVCGAGIDDSGYLCGKHAGLLARNLVFVADGATELQTTITRQDRIGEGAGGRSAVSAVPFNEAAALVEAEVRSLVLPWARRIADRASARVALRMARARAAGRSAELAAAASLIHGHLRQLRARPDVEDLYRDIDTAYRRLARVCDIPLYLVDLGLCGTEGCDGRLLAQPGARQTRCRSCGAPWSVAAVSDMLLDWAGDQLYTASKLEHLLNRLLPDLPRRVKAGTIRSWGKRGMIGRRGRIGNAWLYRLSEARALAERLQDEESASA